MIAADRLAAVMEATWPPQHSHRLGPWTIRDGAGGGKRVSAASAGAEVSAADLPQAETAMRAIGQPALFLIRPADTFTLSELLLQAFSGQIASKEIGEHARQKVLNLFDREKMLAQTLTAYRQARHRFVTAHRPFFSLARSLGSQ